MSSYRGMSSQSPYSSSDHGYSAEGTPDTSLTAFSPEEVRPSRPSNASSTGAVTLGAGQHDPFVTSAQPTARSLSATASTFRPLALGMEAKSSSAPQDILASSAIQAVQPECGNHLNSVYGSIASPTQFGTFSTDTGARRNLKISSIYDAEVKPLVDASMEVYMPCLWQLISPRTLARGIWMLTLPSETQESWLQIFRRLCGTKQGKRRILQVQWHKWCFEGLRNRQDRKSHHPRCRIHVCLWTFAGKPISAISFIIIVDTLNIYHEISPLVSHET